MLPLATTLPALVPAGAPEATGAEPVAGGAEAAPVEEPPPFAQLIRHQKMNKKKIVKILVRNLPGIRAGLNVYNIRVRRSSSAVLERDSTNLMVSKPLQTSVYIYYTLTRYR